MKQSISKCIFGRTATTYSQSPITISKGTFSRPSRHEISQSSRKDVLIDGKQQITYLTMFKVLTSLTYMFNYFYPQKGMITIAVATVEREGVGGGEADISL